MNALLLAGLLAMPDLRPRVQVDPGDPLERTPVVAGRAQGPEDGWRRAWPWVVGGAVIAAVLVVVLVPAREPDHARVLVELPRR